MNKDDVTSDTITIKNDGRTLSNGQFVADNSPDFVNQESKDSEKVFDTDDQQSDTVKYSTYKKVLNQYKNLKKDYEEVAAYKKDVEEKELAKKGEFEKLIQARDERINELQKSLNAVNQEKTESLKFNAITKSLPGELKKPEYLSFLDVDSIQIDNESGEIDKISLENAVNKFVQQYGEDFLIMNKQKGLPTANLKGRPNLKTNLKNLSNAELKQAYLSGNWQE